MRSLNISQQTDFSIEHINGENVWIAYYIVNLQSIQVQIPDRLRHGINEWDCMSSVGNWIAKVKYCEQSKIPVAKSIANGIFTPNYRFHNFKIYTEYYQTLFQILVSCGIKEDITKCLYRFLVKALKGE